MSDGCELKEKEKKKRQGGQARLGWGVGGDGANTEMMAGSGTARDAQRWRGGVRVAPGSGVSRETLNPVLKSIGLLSCSSCCNDIKLKAIVMLH